MPVIKIMRRCLGAACVAIAISVLLSSNSGIGEYVNRVWADDGRQVQSVSLIELIANPDAFRGKVVRVKGFGVVEFEYVALMLSEKDARYLITKSGIWLDLNREQLREYGELSHRYISVEGVFNPDNMGHFDGWSGALEEITRIEPLLTVEELGGQEGE